MSCKKHFFSFMLLAASSILFFNTDKIAHSVTQTACNINSECRAGFVCVGGLGENWNAQTGSQGNTLYGYCEPIGPIRQICRVHNTITGVYGQGIVALVLISLGIAFLTGKIDQKQILTVGVGIICIFGSYQLVSFIVGEQYQMCDIINTDDAPNTPAPWIYTDLDTGTTSTTTTTTTP